METRVSVGVFFRHFLAQRRRDLREIPFVLKPRSE